MHTTHQCFSFLFLIEGKIDISDEVLDGIVTIVFELTHFLRKYHKLKDISVEGCQVFSGALEAESTIVIGKGITDLFNVISVGQEVY